MSRPDFSGVNLVEVAADAWASTEKRKTLVWRDERTHAVFALFVPDLGLGGEHHRVRRLDGGPFVQISKADVAVMRAHRKHFVSAVHDLRIDTFVSTVLPVQKDRHALAGKARGVDLEDHECRDWDETGCLIEQCILVPIDGWDRLLEIRAAYVATLGHAVESRGEPEARRIERAQRTMQ